MVKKKRTNIRIFRWLLPFLLIGSVFWFSSSLFAPASIYTSEGIELLKGDTVEKAVINDVTQQVDLTLSKPYSSKYNQEGISLSPFSSASKNVVFTFSTAQAKQIDSLVQNANPKKGFNSIAPRDSLFTQLLLNFLPLILILGVAWWIFGKMQGGGGMMGFGRSRFKQLDASAPKVKFHDVAGADEAVEELREIQEFLSEPDKFHNLGARIPKGVLLCGPPGTGKTLLAKAVAGEAKVPFFSLSGSEFVEMFVGVGASRVRDLFAQAKSAAPAIIFVDEIDAVGRHRGTGMGGGNDEREQTLNQLLVEMDGFDANTNVILIAATNRPDVLDPALLRPGRFDRQINIDVPDMKGRLQILKVHAKDKPMTTDVDLQLVAKRTPGFSGADLANVLNEAALLTARFGGNLIDMRAMDEAIDRVIAGPQRRTRVMNDHDKLVTAYHEGGHALCAAALRYSDPVTKVTILPRGRALGYTMVMPSEDRYSRTRNQLLDELVYALGGRVAEEMIFEDPSTGASNDIQKATATARKLVTDYGMSWKVGLVKLGKEDSEPFLGGRGFESRDYSEETAAKVDAEVRGLLDDANREAWELLSRNRHILDNLAERLLEKETVLEEELAEIFANVIKQPKRSLWSYGREYVVDEAMIGNPIVAGGENARGRHAR